MIDVNTDNVPSEPEKEQPDGIVKDGIIRQIQYGCRAEELTENGKNMNELRKAVFLDRDGTVNIERQYLYKAEDFEYMEGAVEGLRQLQAWGYLLIMVTNQSGIARGYYSEDEFHGLTNWMLSDLKAKGVHIDGVYYCPHHPEGKIIKYRKDCGCRKPKTGLFYLAARDFCIDIAQSIAIGDRERDLAICSETGAIGILLSEKSSRLSGCISCRNWNEIIHKVSSIEKHLKMNEDR